MVWPEVTSATTVYRWRHAVGQVGLPAFVLYNVGYFGGLVVWIGVAHGIGNPGAGAGVGLGMFLLCVGGAVVVARKPDVRTGKKVWDSSAWSQRVYYLDFDSVSPFFFRPFAPFLVIPPVTEARDLFSLCPLHN